MTISVNGNSPIRLIASDKSWIEGEALAQLKKTSALEGMKLAVGFPDLHPGRGHPVGAAFITQGLFYPHLAGNDIGCAMGAWQTDLACNKVKLDTFYQKVKGLDSSYEGSLKPWHQNYELPVNFHDSALGTIGGGNHFVELQKVETIFDEAVFQACGLLKDRCFVLVHSGSRSLGEAIYLELMRLHGTKGLVQGTEEAQAYMQRHNYACRWAAASRALIVERFCRQLKTQAVLISDSLHNAVTQEQWKGELSWIHRKGAASTHHPVVMIPGSRGTYSYLVKPIGDQTNNAFSIAHGAGRKWMRSEARERLKNHFTFQALQKTDLGSRVICEDRELIYEEAPQAYKNINQVIDDLVQAGIVQIVARYQPLLTYKMRREK